MSIITFLLFILILTFLIFIHELGHFLAAKWTGMKVEEFSIGFFKPVLYSKKIGETTYSIRGTLLGGYVKILGENDEESAEHNPRAFVNRPWWAQFLTLIAGVTMNLIFAYLLFVATAYGPSIVTTDDPDFQGRIKNERMFIADVLPESPARNAGIAPGATLLEVKARGEKAPLATEEGVISFLGRHQNDSITVTYQNRNEVKASTTIALVYGLIKDKPETKALGISLEKVGDVQIGFFESFKIGAHNLVRYTELTLKGLYGLVASLFKGENVLDSLSGPVGIASLVGQATDVGYRSVLLLMGFLSLNLAILNVLPLPALDGGQIVKVTLEALFRRKLKRSYTEWLNVIGFLFLMGLLVIVTAHDVFKLFK
jgi:regulator of sigma E protease